MAALGLIMVAACSKTDAQQTTLPNQSEVVATVGTSQVTLAEVDTRALQEPVSSFGSAKLVQALATLDHKRDKNPPKKHGNIPL